MSLTETVLFVPLFWFALLLEVDVGFLSCFLPPPMLSVHTDPQHRGREEAGGTGTRYEARLGPKMKLTRAGST